MAKIKDLCLSSYFRLWLLALLPRIILVALFIHYPIALDDMFQYDMLARSLIENGTYRWYASDDVEALRPYLSQFLDLSEINPPPEGIATTHRAPGYPAFLAGLYLMTPLESRFAFVRLAQTAFTALLTPLVALLALKLRMGRRIAVAAGIAMALYPILLFYPIALASENLFIPLVLLSFLALLKAKDARRLWPCLLAGFILGLAILTRSILWPFVLLAAAWLWRFGQTRAKGALLMLTVALGLSLPWAIRNSITLQRPTFIESSMGYNLFIGYHPEGNGGFISEIAIIPLTILEDGERDRYCTQAALSFIRADPAEAALRVARRAAFLVGMEDREMAFFYSNGFFGAIPQPWLALIYLWLILPWIAVGIGAILGLPSAPQRPAAWLMLALLVGYALPHLLIIAEPRFHLAIIPVLIPFSAWGWSRPREISKLIRRQADPSIWLARLAFIMLIGLWVWYFAMNWARLLAILGPEGNELFLSY